jgi:integrase
MKSNEIASLSIANIVEVEGAWALDLRGLDLINEASKRIVPIPQKLIDVGFLSFVDKGMGKQNTFLFEEVRKCANSTLATGYGERINRWFNSTVLKNIGIDKVKERQNKTDVMFNFFRHTFMCKLVNAGVKHTLIGQLAGHT